MTNTPDMPVQFTDPGQAYEDRLEPVDPTDVPEMTDADRESAAYAWRRSVMNND